jgi:hypothetical protein
LAVRRTFKIGRSLGMAAAPAWAGILTLKSPSGRVILNVKTKKTMS